MEKSTHSERVAVALAMRAACAAACEERAPAKESDHYRASSDHWRIAADTVARVDAVALVNATEPPPPRSAQEAFEAAAGTQHFNCQKKDDGNYLHPITGRAWALWQMALQFKMEADMQAVLTPAPSPQSELIDAMTVIAAQPAPEKTKLVIKFGDEGTPPTLKLGVICERLRFTVNAEFLAQLGFVATTEKGARLYHEGQFPLICGAIIKHITAVANQFIHQEESEK